MNEARNDDMSPPAVSQLPDHPYTDVEVSFSLDRKDSNDAGKKEETREQLKRLILQEEEHYLWKGKNSDFAAAAIWERPEEEISDNDSDCCEEEEFSRASLAATCSGTTPPPGEEERPENNDEEEEEEENHFQWRSQMLEWSFQVIDQFGIDREVVAVAFNIFDRYVAKESSGHPFTIEDYQLLSMTSLFVAVKILGSYPRKISIKALVAMSRGYYCEDDIRHTELDLLGVLGWRVNPPTALAFCRLFAELLDLSDLDTICRHVTEKAVNEPLLLGKKSCHVGLAVVLYAARCAGHQTSDFVFSKSLRGIIGFEANDEFDRVTRIVERMGTNNNNNTTASL